MPRTRRSTSNGKGLITIERNVFYETDRPTKNALEKKWIETTSEKVGSGTNLENLQKTFERIK